MIIRKYRSKDFARLYEIDHAAFSPGIAYSHLELQFYVRCRRCTTRVAEDDGEVVGFAIGCSEPPNLGHLITIDVVPHRQRQQIGSRLLTDIENWLWETGARMIYLETAIDDTGARGFYERHDYFVFEELERYYNNEVSAFVMVKTTKRRRPTPRS